MIVCAVLFWSFLSASCVTAQPVRDNQTEPKRLANDLIEQKLDRNTVPNPEYKLYRLAATILEMDQVEFESSFDVILKYQIGEISLGKLSKMDDSSILAQIDYSQYPYNEVDVNNIEDLLKVKRRELETRSLATIAAVDYEKFSKFYNNFPLIAGTVNSLFGNNYQTDEPEIVRVTCDRACQDLARGRISGVSAMLNFNADGLRYEFLFGNLTNGSRLVITSQNSGNTVTIRKFNSSIAWQVVATSITMCGRVACKL